MSGRKRTFQLTPQAEADIEHIVRWIAQDNIPAALRMFDRFYDAFRLIVANPRIGHKRKDLTDRNVLFWSVKPRYHVIYSVNFEPLLIVRVLPADRDIASLLTRE